MTAAKLYETEKLTPEELVKLKSIVLGYGNFKKTAHRAEMPMTTLRDVINRGYGLPETIKKLREKVLNAESNQTDS